MAPVRRVGRDEILALLTEATDECGMSLRDFYELGRHDDLDNPRLRDLWLIYGGELTAEDLGPVSV